LTCREVADESFEMIKQQADALSNTEARKRQNYPTRFEIELSSLDAGIKAACTSQEQESVSMLGCLIDVRTLILIGVSYKARTHSMVGE